jgi:eukaryotic-like serine/threonine-protein kinase
MSSPSSSPLNPALLPPGTQVGPFRVVDWAGRGVHGAVYRAVRIGQEHLPPVALKLALLPDDPRATRERELLSRTLHPHIPRLVDHGLWQSPSGSLHPFLAMEWIDGVPLYDWARLFHSSAAQQLRLLAQVALTLQYLHAQGAFHRDLKGGNLLVRRCDSRLFLTDFGSGIYPDADTLTPQQLPPGTPAYRSPEAWLFNLQFRHTSERYRAGPADDVFALGVTACVLATGSYPDMGPPRKDEHGTWHMDSLVLPNALFSSRVAGPLRGLILRMLSIRPEQRGTPAELAEALEQAADSLTPPRPLPSASEAEPATVRSAEAPARSPRAPVHARPLGLTLAILAGAIATWAGWMARAAFFPTPEAPPRASQAAHPAAREGSPEERPVGLGEAAASTATPGPALPSTSEPLAQDTPPEPFEGQTQPDKKGRCPYPQHVILNGNCWGRMRVDPQECELGGGQMYQGACYVPILRPGSKRPNTSNPGTPR